MAYYHPLSLEKEPFSNSPDPGLFFSSKQHRTALQQLEISIRLKRGLNVITGDVGTGKTTVCRQLIRKISGDKNIRSFLILDPGFASPVACLASIYNHFTGKKPGDTPANELALKEKIKEDLFSKGVNQKMTTVLLIDEGQKLSPACLETLRELLNFETNEIKLLQIVIFAQKEFDSTIAGMENFVDRINFRFMFSPLNFAETRGLIEFRIQQCASPGRVEATPRPLFSFFGLWAVFRLTRGYPRKIINLCHHVILAMIVQEIPKAGSFFIHNCARTLFAQTPRPPGKGRFPLGYFALALLVIGVSLKAGNFLPPQGSSPEIPGAVSFPITAESAQAKGPKITEPFDPNRGTALHARDAGVTDDQTMGLKLKPDTDSATGSLPEKEELPVQARPPGILGTVKIPKDETLYNMILAVYGSYSHTAMTRLLEANPGIKTPNLIPSGLEIHFPVIQDKAFQWRPGQACLADGPYSGFDRAYTRARSLRGNGRHFRVLALWRNNQTMEFYAVMDHPFETIAAAQSFLDNQPMEEALALQARPVADVIQEGKLL